MRSPCTNCGTTKAPGQWWNLHNYFKINGRFCPACYDKVKHDPYDQPKNPKDYLMILLKHSSPTT